MATKTWYKGVDVGELPVDQVMTVNAGVISACLIHTEQYGYTAIDNRCPHQYADLPYPAQQQRNSELGKISKEQRAGQYQTSLHNPNFAQLCGGTGIRVTEQVAEAIKVGLAADGPVIVESLTDPKQT